MQQRTDSERLCVVEEKVDNISTELGRVRTSVDQLVTSVAALGSTMCSPNSTGSRGLIAVKQTAPWAIGGTGLGALIMRLIEVLSK